jgi:hypothetical protein
MLKRMTGLCALLTALVFAPGVAHADGHWSAMAATCRPDDGDLVPPFKFRFDIDGSTSFATGQSGIFTLRCDIVNPRDDGSDPTDWLTADITYQDSSTVLGEKVIVDLIEVDGWGTTTNVETLLDSENLAATSKWTEVAHRITTTFYFGLYNYYVSIALYRTGTTAKEKVLFVGF